MKKIINWIKSSNHYYHIGLLAALSLVMMSIGAFEFGAQGLWMNVWQCVKFGLLTGVVIEVYQAITLRNFDWRNSLGDLLADIIGLVLGIGAYLLLAWGAPVTAIVLYIVAFCSMVSAIFYQDKRYYLLMLFFGSALLALSLFIYS